jgi:nucleoside recognition membrane protein YjiH
MLSATFGLLGAPILRLLLLTTHLDFDPAANLALVLTDAFFLPCFVYDLLTRGSIHRAYVYTLALFIVSQVVFMSVKAWGPWLAFSRSVQHLLG